MKRASDIAGDYEGLVWGLGEPSEGLSSSFFHRPQQIMGKYPYIHPDLIIYSRLSKELSGRLIFM